MFDTPEVSPSEETPKVFLDTLAAELPGDQSSASVTPPAELVPSLPPLPPGSHAESRVFPPTWALLLIVLGVLLIIAAAIGTLLSNQRAQPTGGAEPQAIEKLSTFTSPPELPADMIVLQENGNPLPAAVPLYLTMRDQEFTITPVTMEDQRWPIPAVADHQTVWIYGTVINYVIGIPYTQTSEALLAGLDSASRITVTLNTGTELVFGNPQAQRVPENDISDLSQNRPGLTLVLLTSSTTDRLVVQARYLPEEGATSGNAQKVNTVQVAVADSGIFEASTDGLQRFIVEYEVTNVGAAPVDPNLFDMALEDGLGQRYALNPETSALGEAGPLLALVPAGTMAAGSAGYQVPRDLTPPLTWIFRADPTSAETARFSLPYQPPAPAPGQPQVEISSAFVDGRRDLIVINGVVRNVGESVLSVSFDNVKLTSSMGQAILQAATPALPWSLPAGGQQLFELQFVRPTDVDSVLLDVWGFTFQIEGLP